MQQGCEVMIRSQCYLKNLVFPESASHLIPARYFHNTFEKKFSEGLKTRKHNTQNTFKMFLHLCRQRLCLCTRSPEVAVCLR